MKYYCFKCLKSFDESEAEICPKCTWYICPYCKTCLCDLSRNERRVAIAVWLGYAKYLDDSEMELWIKIAETGNLTLWGGSEVKDTIVRCRICGREESVSFVKCLVEGWPTCCTVGVTPQTMEIVKTDADISEATRKALCKIPILHAPLWRRE